MHGIALDALELSRSQQGKEKEAWNVQQLDGGAWHVSIDTEIGKLAATDILRFNKLVLFMMLVLRNTVYFPV